MSTAPQIHVSPMRLPARVAAWSARNPRTAVFGAIVILMLSLASISRMRVTASLSAMLGEHSSAGGAMQRVTSDYRAMDALLVLVELPTGREADDAGQAELVSFAERLESAVRSDAAIAALAGSVRFRQDPDFIRYAREVVLPNGPFYLSEDGLTQLLQRLTPQAMRDQMARNEAMIAAPGPAGGALSRNVLRDSLRLFELIPEGMAGAGGFDAGSGTTSSDRAASAVTAPEFSTDHRALLVRIEGSRPMTDLGAASRLTEEMSRLIEKANISGLRVDLAGPAAISSTSSHVIRRDAIVSTLVSVGLLYLLFVIFQRRWVGALLIGGVAGVGMLAGFGVHALVVPDVSPLAAAVAALLAGLGVDYGIHFMSHYDGHRAAGLNSAEASVLTAREMALPIITNCFTSIFGFASLWPSQIRMLSDFATMGTAGLLGALVAVFGLLPALLCLTDRREMMDHSHHARFGGLAEVVAKRPKVWMTSSFLAMGLVLGAAGLQGFVPQIETDLTVMHPRPNRALEATGEIVKRFSGQGEFIPIEVRAVSADALIATVHDVAKALRSDSCREADVVGVMGLHLLVPDPRVVPRVLDRLVAVDPEKTVEGFDAAIAESAFDAAAFRAYRDFLRTLVSSRRSPGIAEVMKFPSIAGRMFPRSMIDAGKEPTDTVLVVRLESPLHDRGDRERTIGALTNAVRPFPGVTVAGLAAVSNELEEATRTGLAQSVALSIGLVLAWLLIVFRRPMDVLLALVPLLFAGVTTVLFMVAANQRFNPINSVAIPLLDGIAVDAGVFLVSVARTHASREELRKALRTTTHAVLLAVSTTVTGFGALCFTHTPAIRSLGMVAAVGITASMLGALFVLMPILIWRASDRRSV